jgi:cytochrome c553
MARFISITCAECHQQKEISIRAGDFRTTVCHDCAGKRFNEKRKQELAKLANLPIEERIARIEGWIYDYRPVHVPPPRF